MAAQKGKDVLLKIGDGANPENFTTVGGLRTKTLSLNTQTVDATHSESAGWRDLIAGAGVRSASVSGAGVFVDDAAAEAARAAFFGGAIQNWRLVLPDFGEIEGPFQISNIDFSGAYDGAATMSIALESVGALTFTAA